MKLGLTLLADRTTKVRYSVHFWKGQAIAYQTRWTKTRREAKMVATAQLLLHGEDNIEATVTNLRDQAIVDTYILVPVGSRQGRLKVQREPNHLHTPSP